MKLGDMLKDDLECKSHRKDNYRSTDQVLIALRFFATGSMQLVLGDTFDENASQPSVSRIIHRVAAALARRYPQVIKARFPVTADQIKKSHEEFFKRFGMPNVLGCIDGTHFSLISSSHFLPGKKFYGRKGCTINCQFVCDSRGRFTAEIALLARINDWGTLNWSCAQLNFVTELPCQTILTLLFYMHVFIMEFLQY